MLILTTPPLFLSTLKIFLRLVLARNFDPNFRRALAWICYSLAKLFTELREGEIYSRLCITVVSPALLIASLQLASVLSR